MKDWLGPRLFTYAACVPMAIKSNSGLWKQIHVIPHIMSGNLNVNKNLLQITCQLHHVIDLLNCHITKITVFWNTKLILTIWISHQYMYRYNDCDCHSCQSNATLVICSMKVQQFTPKTLN